MQNIYGYNSMIPLVSKFPKGSITDCRNGDEGCYRFDGTVCEFMSHDSCTAMPNYKEVCKNGECYNSAETCQNAHSSPSPPSPITQNTPWNSKTIDYIMSQIPTNMNGVSKKNIPDLFHCMINKAQSKNISPYDVLNGTGALTTILKKSISLDCLKKIRGSSGPNPPPPPPPSPHNFLSTTAGKITIILVILIVLLGLIGLTRFITQNKPKK